MKHDLPNEVSEATVISFVYRTELLRILNKITRNNISDAETLRVSK